MRPPDAKVFDVFGNDDCRSILDLLIASEEPLTQGEIASALKLQSSLASKRMADIEAAGLVTRISSHAPYELLSREMVQGLLEVGADLAGEAADRTAAAAKALRDKRRISRMRGNALPRSAKEGP